LLLSDDLNRYHFFMREKFKFLSFILILSCLLAGCSSAESTSSESASSEEVETDYSKYLLRNYFIEGGCNKTAYTTGTIRDNSASGAGASNGWTLRSFNETAENAMKFDVLQILDITDSWIDGIDKRIFSRVRNIEQSSELDLTERNLNTLSMLVFLEQTIGETDAMEVLSKKAYFEDINVFPKNKSKIKNLRKMIRSNADTACEVVFEMGVITNLGKLPLSEQDRLDSVSRNLKKIIGFNGVNVVTDIENWIAKAHAEGEMETIRQQIEGDKQALISQAQEEAFQEYLEGAKPRCVEYPSDNPKYVVVKCTNIP
jgi:hypothetical protein